MSNQEANEYMKNVKWTTGLYLLASTVSIVLTISGIYYGLKGDIKDNKMEAKEQIQYVFNKLNTKIDSNQRVNDSQFKDILQQISDIPPAQHTTIIKRQQVSPKPRMRFFIEKWVNGKLAFIPVDGT